VAKPALQPAPQTAYPNASPDPKAAPQSAHPSGESGGQHPANAPKRNPQMAVDYVDKNGFTCHLTFEADTAGGAVQMQQQVSEFLVKAGMHPVTLIAHPTPNSGGQAPHCKYHGGPMKMGKGGKWFCPKKIAGGEYCDYTADG
jgi:hypothetical protein